MHSEVKPQSNRSQPQFGDQEALSLGLRFRAIQRGFAGKTFVTYYRDRPRPSQTLDHHLDPSTIKPLGEGG